MSFLVTNEIRILVYRLVFTGNASFKDMHWILQLQTAGCLTE